jgi:hypothetical protein
MPNRLLALGVHSRLGINFLPVVAALKQREAIFNAGQQLNTGCRIAGDDIQCVVAQLWITLKSDVMTTLVHRALYREFEIGAEESAHHGVLLLLG